MRLTYYDESGDDGYLNYSSPIFALTAIYMHYLHWKDNFEKIYEFRKIIREHFKIPIKLELHAKYLSLNKKPCVELNISEYDRIKLFDLMCELIAIREWLDILSPSLNKAASGKDEYGVVFHPS